MKKDSKGSKNALKLGINCKIANINYYCTKIIR